MFPPIRCTTCGHILGIYYRLFTILKTKYLKDNFGIIENPDSMYFDFEHSFELGDILDQLKIFKYCCRTHLITSRPILEYFQS